MDDRLRAVIVVGICVVAWMWLNTSRTPARIINTTQTIPANSVTPVFGFYADRPTLVTLDGQACSTRRTDECWGPDGELDFPPQLQLAKTLMQVNGRGDNIPYAVRGRYRA